MVDFAGVVLPHGSRDSGCLVMIRGYFDDSGTHGNSHVVVMAGLFGYPNQWDYLSQLWAKKLADPCPGKEPLPRFHMAACQAADEEFLGWKRLECEYLVDELIEIIGKTGIHGFGCSIPRKAYEELITGDRRRASGDPETACIINCFVRFVDFARFSHPTDAIAFIFDDRPQQKSNVEKLWNVYKGAQNGRPEIVSATFGSSKKLLPLQAADLLAWEVYQDALDVLNADVTKSAAPRRRTLKKMMDSGKIQVDFGTRETVQRLAECDLPTWKRAWEKQTPSPNIYE